MDANMLPLSPTIPPGAERPVDPFLRASSILAHTTGSRAQVYNWLSRCFYPPDREFAILLESGKFKDGIAGTTLWLGKDQVYIDACLEQIQTGNLNLDGLEAEYQRLFGKSIERVVQHEAAYRWRGVTSRVGDTRFLRNDLIAQYSQVGLTAEDGMEDHLAVELEFLGFLCFRESTAWKQGAFRTAKAFRRKERQFICDHLSQWIPEFYWRMTRRNSQSIYAGFACFLDVWLGLDFGPDYPVQVKRA